MLCNNCGSEISNGSSFCNICGAKQLAVHSQLSQPDRENLLRNLNRVHNEAVKCTPYYAENASLQNYIDTTANKTYTSNSWKPVFFIGLAPAILSVITLLGKLTGDGINEFGSWISDIFLASLIPGIWLFLWIFLRKNGQEKIRRKTEADRQGIESARQRQAVLADSVSAIYQASGVSDFYPPKYFHVDAVNYVYDCISNYRADSLKEALNSYEEYLHRMRMEQAQSEQLKALQRAELLLRRIEINSAAAAIGSML